MWNNIQSKLTLWVKAQFKPKCDIPENFATNEYPNIFVSTNLHEWMSEYIHVKSLTWTNVRINIFIENCANIRMCSDIRLVFALYHTHERMSEYIRTNKFDTNEK